jgi:hypothetical protein
MLKIYMFSNIIINVYGQVHQHFSIWILLWLTRRKCIANHLIKQIWLSFKLFLNKNYIKYSFVFLKEKKRITHE